jgi:uncharacterized protein YjcR
MPRGGPRPGAGAPKGNLNALKTGAHSKQLRAAIGALMAVPQTRRAMFALLQQKQRDTRRFRDIIFNAAKLVHDAELSASISRQLEQEIRRTQEEK